jgi:hypothetical protein
MNSSTGGETDERRHVEANPLTAAVFARRYGSSFEFNSVECSDGNGIALMQSILVLSLL